MAKLTITEALAEIKTIKARTEKKQASIMRYFARDSRTKDPLEADGGSIDFVRRERQGIADLLARWVRIRTAIQRANVSTSLKVQDVERNVADWLNWRREVAPIEKSQLQVMVQGVNTIRQQALKQGAVLVEKETGAKDVQEVIVAVNETELAKSTESLESILGELDGKLSLVNATTVIEVE